jgi:hypothetical protein
VKVCGGRMQLSVMMLLSPDAVSLVFASGIFGNCLPVFGLMAYFTIGFTV